MLLFCHRVDSASVWLHNKNMMNATEHTMARMNDLMIDLQDAVRKGEHSFEDIARIYDVPQHWVDLALGEVLEQ
nr:hypothetical protein [Betaproteobacteria bacterium]